MVQSLRLAKIPACLHSEVQRIPYNFDMTSLEEYEPYVTQDMVDRGHARPLDLLEDYFAMLLRQRMYRNFNMYAELSQTITKAQLSSAFRSMLLQYPILACTVIPKKFPNYETFYNSEEFYNTPYYNRDYVKVSQRIDLHDVLLNEQLEHKELVEEICAQFIEDNYEYTGKTVELLGAISFSKFDGRRPNWRVLCLPSPGEKGTEVFSKLVYISNHCLSDGISGVNFFKDLTRFLTEKESLSQGHNDDYNIIDYLEDQDNIPKLPPPITKYVDYKVNLMDLGRLMLSNLAMNHLRYKSDGSVTSRMEGHDLQTYHHKLNYTFGQVLSLKKKIKENIYDKCTLTPFLQVCFSVALYRHGKIFKKNWAEWGFDVAIAKNSRPLLPEDDELRDLFKYGSNVSGLHYLYLIASFDIKRGETDKFWQLVEYYHKCMLNEHDALVGFGTLMMDQVCKKQNTDKIICNDYLNHKRGGLLLSNVGYHAQNTSGSIYAKDLLFSQTPGGMKFTFGMAIISSDEGGMNIDLSVVRSAMPDRREWLAFCEEFSGLVEAL